MTEIVLATKNKNKIIEISKYIKDIGIKVLTFEGIEDFPEVIEDGKSMEENAAKKAKSITVATGKISLADDSGLEVDALNGIPGVLSARFAYDGCSYSENNIKLLSMMKNLLEEKRKAQFKCVMVLANSSGEVEAVEGICRGRITFEERGSGGFGYDPVFIPEGYDKTFAELGIDVKNKISHRAKALQKVLEILKNRRVEE